MCGTPILGQIRGIKVDKMNWENIFFSRTLNINECVNEFVFIGENE